MVVDDDPPMLCHHVFITSHDLMEERTNPGFPQLLLQLSDVSHALPIALEEGII